MPAADNAPKTFDSPDPVLQSILMMHENTQFFINTLTIFRPFLSIFRTWTLIPWLIPRYATTQPARGSQKKVTIHHLIKLVNLCAPLISRVRGLCKPGVNCLNDVGSVDQNRNTPNLIQSIL
ncbi:MAG: hypothetical protein D5S03_01530 [Desulfonatronospira sp. MSAO_Bac3]|nr:MAG: hypothetical protein D5S03_01530 [Desulfonatronospira sp. MSAO_Bac3]